MCLGASYGFSLCGSSMFSHFSASATTHIANILCVMRISYSLATHHQNLLVVLLRHNLKFLATILYYHIILYSPAGFDSVFLLVLAYNTANQLVEYVTRFCCIVVLLFLLYISGHHYTVFTHRWHLLLVIITISSWKLNVSQ